jgi:hypothetical protein
MRLQRAATKIEEAEVPEMPENPSHEVKVEVKEEELGHPGPQEPRVELPQQVPFPPQLPFYPPWSYPAPSYPFFPPPFYFREEE